MKHNDDNFDPTSVIPIDPDDQSPHDPKSTPSIHDEELMQGTGIYDVDDLGELGHSYEDGQELNLGDIPVKTEITPPDEEEI